MTVPSAVLDTHWPPPGLDGHTAASSTSGILTALGTKHSLTLILIVIIGTLLLRIHMQGERAMSRVIRCVQYP